jgi:hypothetical protein
VRVLASRKLFIEKEQTELSRGIEHWPEHLQRDFFTS